jgi:hypothetical protein
MHFRTDCAPRQRRDIDRAQRDARMARFACMRTRRIAAARDAMTHVATRFDGPLAMRSAPRRYGSNAAYPGATLKPPPPMTLAPLSR